MEKHCNPFLKKVGKKLFFTAYANETGNELWITDGTTNGTILLKEICKVENSSLPDGLTNINGNLFFSAFDSVHGREVCIL